MDSKLKRNYVYNLLSQLLTIIIPVITTPYVSRVLSAKAIGDFGYTDLSFINQYDCIFLYDCNARNSKLCTKRNS